MVRALLASLLVAVGADDSASRDEEAAAMLQSRVRTQGLDDDDVGPCAGKEEYCMDINSMSGKCLRKQPLWDFPWGYWNCERGAKYCGHHLWMFDVTRCCPGVCAMEELYRATAPVFNNGGIGECEKSADICKNCEGTSTMCLQKRDHWSPEHTCENSKEWCPHEKWGKDMLECCPGVCNTEADSMGACKFKGCSKSTEQCDDCTDNSDLCLRQEWHLDSWTCEKAADEGYCNHENWGDQMLKCCPGICETKENGNGGCVLSGCQLSEDTCTDCNQNSDKCLLKRHGDFKSCRAAKEAGMCTWDKDDWTRDMLECCPKECGAVKETGDVGQTKCVLTGCQAKQGGECGDCTQYSDRCMQEHMGKPEYTCEKARDKGYCSTRHGKGSIKKKGGWKFDNEAMNNCCPGMCMGEHKDKQNDMIPDWAVCRGGRGNGADGVVTRDGKMNEFALDTAVSGKKSR